MTTTITLEDIKVKAKHFFARTHFARNHLSFEVLAQRMLDEICAGPMGTLGCSILGEHVLYEAGISTRDGVYCVEPQKQEQRALWTDMTYGRAWSNFAPTGYIGNLFGKPAFSDIVLPPAKRFVGPQQFVMLPIGHPVCLKNHIDTLEVLQDDQ